MLGTRDVVAVMEAQPRRKEWLLSELVETCGHLVTATEAVEKYRRLRNFTEETDPNKDPLDKKIRIGRQAYVTIRLGTAVKQGRVEKSGGHRGPDVRYKLLPKTEEGIKAKIGFSRDDVRAAILALENPRVINVVLYLLPRTSQIEALRRWNYKRKSLAKPRKVCRTKDKIHYVLLQHVLRELAYILREVNGKVIKPSIEESQIKISDAGRAILRTILAERTGGGKK